MSNTFAALADPTRRAILARLATSDAAVGELADPFDMSLPAISKHLKVLERAGLISRSREAQWRPCRLQPAPLKDATAWIEKHREIWERRLDRLDSYLRELKAAGSSENPGSQDPGLQVKKSNKKNRESKEKRHGRKRSQ